MVFHVASARACFFFGQSIFPHVLGHQGKPGRTVSHDVQGGRFSNLAQIGPQNNQSRILLDGVQHPQAFVVNGSFARARHKPNVHAHKKMVRDVLSKGNNFRCPFWLLLRRGRENFWVN